MRAVVLMSGGLDSTLLGYLALDEGYEVFPLFVDYGQLAAIEERVHCAKAIEGQGFEEPQFADLQGFGKLIPSGLTNANLDVVEDAFTPGRNSLFLLCAASYAATIDAQVVMVGLLDERFHLFSDQTEEFLHQAERFLAHSIGREISIKAPLMAFSKKEVIAMSEARKLGRTYSCHVGGAQPCGQCIACREFEMGD